MFCGTLLARIVISCPISKSFTNNVRYVCKNLFAELISTTCGICKAAMALFNCSNFALPISASVALSNPLNALSISSCVISVSFVAASSAALI